MPNRIIKESICTSDTIDMLSWFEEVVFYRLVVNCDDYGRFDGRPAVIRSRLFPLKPSVTEKTVAQAINRLSTVGLVMPYECDGKPTLQLVTWDRHQSVRNKRSKYPAIDGSNETTASQNIQMISSACNCIQLNSDGSKCSRNPIQSESESESESNPNVCAEQKAAAPPEPPVITLPCNDKTEYAVTTAQVAECADLYPAVDVEQELRSMRGWLIANPKKRKTYGGMPRFIDNWLKREQNKGHPTKGGAMNGPGNTGGDTEIPELTRILKV